MVWRPCWLGNVLLVGRFSGKTELRSRADCVRLVVAGKVPFEVGSLLHAVGKVFPARVYCVEVANSRGVGRCEIDWFGGDSRAGARGKKKPPAAEAALCWIPPPWRG